VTRIVILTSVALAGGLLLAMALFGARLWDGLSDTVGADPTLELGFDLATGDNSATAIGSVQHATCNASVNDTFTIDLYVKDVTNVCDAAFIVGFDPSVVELTSFSGPTNWFLRQSGSVPMDMSHPNPATDQTTAEDYPNDAIAEGQDGTYWIQYGELGSCESGTGVIARFGGKAVGTGRTTFNLIEQTDLAQSTPVMYNKTSTPIGDTDGDETYDGVIATAQIAVGMDCDYDGDGMPDTWENSYACTNSQVADAGDDDDSDGLTHLQEYGTGTDPCDNDTDNDTVLDGADANPLNKFVCRDVDADTCDDCSVAGLPQPANDGPDFDADGLCNAGDPDDDNDTVPDAQDTNPLNKFVCLDVDADTCDDCSVAGLPQPANDGTDTDADGLCNLGDPDDDDDGILDDGDASGTIGDNPCKGGNTVHCDDNCRLDVNPGQADGDGDGVGDVCDFDLDGDGVPDSVDNCPQDYNPGQEDMDHDSVGDVCDPDRDGDGIDNIADNCPNIPNPGQEDRDNDNIGDVCDPDRDGDGIGNVADNCPDDYNPGQENSDSDGLGDACDPDDDNDGVPDAADECPTAAEDPDDIDDDGCPDSDPQVTAVAKLYAGQPVATITMGPSTPAQVEVKATIYNGNPRTSYAPTSVKLHFSQTSPALPTPSLCDPADPEYDPTNPLCDPDNDTWINARELELGSDPADPNSTPESLLVLDTCSDDIDNDGVDGKDAADPKCQDPDGDGVPTDLESSYGSDYLDFDSTPEHAALPWTCFDGVDNDLDGSQDQPGESDGPDAEAYGDCSEEQFAAMGMPILACYSGFIRETGDILSQILQPDGTIITDLELQMNNLAANEQRNISRTEIIFCPLLGDATETNTVEILGVVPPVRDENSENNSGSQALNVHVTADLDGDGVIDSLDACPNDPEDHDACTAQEIADSGHSSPPACYDGCPDSDIVVSLQLPVPNPEVLQNRTVTGNQVLLDITNTGVLNVPADVQVTLQQLSGPECISRWDGETHYRELGGQVISERQWQETAMAPGETRHISVTYNITCTDNPGPYRDDFSVFAEPLPLVREEDSANNIQLFTSYVTVLPNADGDNVPDATDQCRDVPEDEDGCSDSDGCPETDADGDGIPDVSDPYCEVPDTDHDGINDPVDACRLLPEIIDGELDSDGCPDSDARVVDVVPHSQINLIVGVPRSESVTATYQNGNEAATLRLTLLDYIQYPQCTGNWTPQAGDTFVSDDVDTNGDTIFDGHLSIIERTYTNVAPNATITLTRQRTVKCSVNTLPPPCADDDVVGTAEVLDPVEDPNLANNVKMVDNDLCAGPDSDGDGILDFADNCPTTPNPGQEDNYGGPAGDACEDTDDDGLADADDSCPLEPEDVDGFQDDDGCPDADNDSDGLLDGVDPCPNDSDCDDDSCIPPDYSDCPGPSGGFFNDAVEVFMGTDPLDNCADTSTANDERGPEYTEPLSPWPPDFNDDGRVNLGDILVFRPHFNTLSGQLAYGQRWDLNRDGRINLDELLVLRPYFNTRCD